MPPARHGSRVRPWQSCGGPVLALTAFAAAAGGAP
eukprot:CAMPEP_0202103390 /NCGR_PEP_ID=MMETSP0965-20130614/4868_1 /ASSEMBLY_ACC=CAM_ASM_000507 /TAXON_ID=4773 /ORGANISM="Schizochytrium aggregatum, Strain ATCC28209" /LENGTH=34 /DNA_ID= /DNA_START= /DNA_END= /DNA_ORIENTATION=